MQRARSTPVNTSRLVVSAAAMALCAAAARPASVADQILGLTGGKRTKLVYVRGSSREQIVTFDTETGSETVVKSGIGEGGAVRPLITADGSRIVYSTGGDIGDFGTRHRVYIMNWNGSGSVQKLGDDGYLASLWVDPSDGEEYAIAMRMDRKTHERIPLSPVGAPQVFWVGPDNCRAELQFSADGHRSCLAADGIGWVDFTQSTPVYHKVGSGCRPSMAPDNSYLWWNFNGPHDGVVMRPASGSSWDVPIPNSQQEAYYPRWTNRKRFMTHTNYLGGDTLAEVFFCQFAADYASIAASVRVTTNGVRDYHPHARIFDSPVVTIDSFEADPASIAPGGSSTLSWSTSDATAVTIGPAIGAVGPSGTVDVTPSSTTTYTLTADGSGGPVTATVEVTVRDPGTLHLKINAGSNAHDVAGWERDDAYVTGGSDYVWSQATDTSGEPDAAPAEVYRSVRHLDHSYSFPQVPNGTYEVRIHFVEGGTGPNRAMDYTAEGVLVLDDLEITSEAGTFEALVKAFSVTVSDGNGLQISCEAGSGNDVFEAGIEIIGDSGPGPNEPPTATILANPITGGAPLTVSFQGVGEDTDGQVVSYRWEFGDGQTSNAQSPSHTYTEAGFYQVRLTVTDDGGATDEETLTITATGISLTSPDGGEVWYVGTTRTIEWTAAIIDNVVILYSSDGGSTWHEIAPSVYLTDASWGAYPWEVPDDPSTECLVCVRGYMLEGGDVSADTFEIRSVTDADGDGMDDGWEADHFGDLSHDGSADGDDDGMTDLDEFLNGRDPTVNEAPPPDDEGDESLSCAPGRAAPRGGALALVLVLAGIMKAVHRARVRGRLWRPARLAVGRRPGLNDARKRV